MSHNRFWRVRVGRWRGSAALLAGVALLAVAAAGCFWPAPGAGPDRAGHNPFEHEITPETVVDLERVWTAGTDGGEVRGPVTSADAVHVAADGSLYGFDTATGGRLWSRTPDNPAPNIWWMDPATFAAGALWSGSGIPNLGGHHVTELLDPTTGEVVGQPGPDGLVDSVRGEGYVLRRPALAGSDPSLPATVSITVRDSEDPEIGWSGIIALLTSPATSRPLTLGTGFVYQAGSGMSVDGAGNMVESTGVRGYSTEEQPEDCPAPDVVPFRIICPSWFTEVGGSTSPVLDPEGDGLFVGGGTGQVHALDGATGDVHWSTPVGSSVTAEPALAGGTLFVPTVDGQLFVLDADTGDVLWTTDDGGVGLEVQPAVAGGVVFAGAADGTLQAFDAAGCGAGTCEPLWSDSLGSEITGAPAVSDGQLYVGTADGRIVAYALP